MIPSGHHTAHAYAVAVRSGPPDLSVIRFGKDAGPRCKFRDRQIKAPPVGSALIERHPLRKAKGGKDLRGLPSSHPRLPSGRSEEHRDAAGGTGQVIPESCADCPFAVAETRHAPRERPHASLWSITKPSEEPCIFPLQRS